MVYEEMMKTLDQLQAEYSILQVQWRAMITAGGHWHGEYISLRDQMDKLDLEMTRITQQA